MNGQKIAVGVLILIAVFFVAGLFASNNSASADPTASPWVRQLQALLPAPGPVTAAQITGSCIQNGTIRVALNTTCTIAIAGNGPTLRSLNLSLPAAPSPFAGEDIDAAFTPNDTSGVAMKALLRGANAKEHSAELKIQSGGGTVDLACKASTSGTCSLAIP